jgi:hypothetical protein
VLSFKKLLAAGCLSAAALAPQAAHAATFLTFSQSGADIVSATVNGGITDITVTNGVISIGTIDAPSVSTPVDAYLTLSAVSSGSASSLGGTVFQSFNGTFSITSGQNDTGINYLTGTFTNAGGGGRGSAFALLASQPPADEITGVTSDRIPDADLSEQLALSLSFTNVNPQVGIDGSTLAGFASNISGTFSGTYPTPEPASMALLLVGLTGIGFLRLRRG